MTTATPSRVEPVRLGPTWERGEDGKFVLPKYTLGWQSLAWAAENLKHGNDKPWRFTNEQARWWLWWFAVDEAGDFLFTQGVLQRLKGWGKDPVAAVLSAVEFVGPCRFDPVGKPFVDPFGNKHPAAKAHPEAWIQIAAVSSEQTKNTMRLFPSLFTKKAIERYRIELNKGVIYANHGAQIIDAVTSNPDTLEGARATQVIKNETHRWRANNLGHEMAEVIENNATKSPDGAARALSITNAYEPSEDSVAQREREAYEEMVAGTSLVTGIMYDSLEAPPEAPLSAEAAPAVIEAIRGDSVWLHIPRLVNRILDPKTPPSRARRFWYNQIETAEDAWIDPKDFDLCGPNDLVDAFLPGDEIVMFFDGSKSDDATGLMGCRISDGHVVTLGMWQKPPGKRGELWTAPRASIDEAVDKAFSTYKVVGFWADPSHTRDDETQERYWDGLVDDWHRRYGDQLEVWAVQGKQGHSVMWDMTSPARVEQFTAAAERCVSDIEETAKAVRLDPLATRLLTHDGDGRLKGHARNAKRYPNRYGVSLWKGHRESKRKVDLAVCMVGARMLRRLVLNNPNRKRKRSGKVW